MTESLRVAVICHFPPPPGGMPAQAVALVNGLRSEGICAIPIPTNLTGNAVTLALDRVRAVRTCVRVPAFLCRLLLAAPRVDVFHILSCSGLAFFLFTLPTILVAKLFRRRAILHYHGGEARVFFARCPKFFRRIVRMADVVVVPSAFLKSVFADLGVTASVVQNICPLDRFRISQPRQASARLIVARHLEPVYNVACILRGFELVKRRYRDASLVVLGGGSEESTLRARAIDLGIADAVSFLGYVRNEDIPAKFAAASIFVNASLADNQPISILEAFAAGLPVITSAAGGIVDIVEHERTGLLFRPTTPEALAESVFRALENPELTRTITARARETVAKYSWERVFPKLAAAYGLKRASAADAIREHEYVH